MAYDGSARIHGLASGKITYYNDFTAERDKDGKWTGSESFQCRLSDSTNLIPVRGAACTMPGWTFLVCNTVKVANIEGDLALVTVSYVGNLNDVDGDEETGGGEDEDYSDYTFELGITTGEEPLETHYRYRTLKDSTDGQTDLNIIMDIKNGKLEKKDRTKPAEYKFVPASDPDATPLELKTDLGKEIWDKMYKKGIEAYLYPAQIWRATFISNKLPSASKLNKVGKIDSPIGAPAVTSGRNWLFLGCNVIDQAGVFTITYEWQLSLEGGWDTDIYS